MRQTLLPMMLSFLTTACGPMTVGESCDMLGTTICTKCFPDEKTACLTGFFSTCCTGSGCERAVRSSSNVLQCNDLLKTAACSSLVQGNLPSVCRGVTAP